MPRLLANEYTRTEVMRHLIVHRYYVCISVNHMLFFVFSSRWEGKMTPRLFSHPSREGFFRGHLLSKFLCNFKKPIPWSAEVIHNTFRLFLFWITLPFYIRLKAFLHVKQLFFCIYPLIAFLYKQNNKHYFSFLEHNLWIFHVIVNLLCLPNSSRNLLLSQLKFVCHL